LSFQIYAMNSINTMRLNWSPLIIPILVLQSFVLNIADPTSSHQTNVTPTTGNPITINTQTGELPKEVARKLKRDAARIALRLAANGEDPRFLGIYIQKESMDQVFSALSNIYLADERGKNLEKCNIHTFPNPSIDHLVIIYEKNVAWAKPLANGLSETDSKTINDLLEKYKLVIEKHVNWTDNQDALTIRSKEPINMAAIANEINNVEGVVEVDLGIPKVVGNDITSKRISGAWELDYTLRFGSWATGKGKSHVWKYRVTDAGKVNFVTETGEPVPDWMKCAIPSEKNNFASKL
jgi:hypothetical protein